MSARTTARPGRPGRWPWFLAITFLTTPLPLAYAAEEERPVLRAGALTRDFMLDGRMTDKSWSAVDDSISNLIMVEPIEGAAPAAPTVVKVLAGQDAIVIGVRCYDKEPKRLVSYSKARDAVLDEEDHVIIVLDPFQDGRSGYVFAVNPAGARFDGLVAARGEEANSDWDAIWEARTSRDGYGWCAEIRIPIASISFPRNRAQWALNVQRRVQRLQETSRWSGINRDYEIYQTSRAGLLTELPAFDLGLGTSVRPAAVGKATKPAPKNEVDYDGELSLDVTQRLGPNLLSMLTVNTDFSETEADVRQINLTRFPISFPEKRTFFQSGSDIFEFGLGLDEETLLPFYTRRIGLVGPDEEEQAVVPVDVGGKVGGRLGGTNFGALLVNTRQVHSLPVGDFGLTVDVPDATMGAVRLKQDIFAESSVGLLTSFGDQLDRDDSWTAGMDFTYQTSRFQGEENLLFGFWGLKTDRKDLVGDKYAYGGSIEYPNDLWDLSLTFMRIGDGFDPSLGFVPRRGVQYFNTSNQFAPRPPLPFVRQMFHEVSYSQYAHRKSDRWESYEVMLKPIDWLFESGDRIWLSIEPQGDRPPAEFEVAPDIDIAPGSYEWTRNIVSVHSSETRKITAEVTSETGGYYTGTLETLLARLALKPSSLFTLELTGERNRGTVMAPENESIELYSKSFKQDLLGCRLELNVSPDFQLSSFTQYDTESRELGSNNRLRWTFNPGGDIFFVYNYNWLRLLNNDWKFQSSQMPVKVQFAWRF